jgi:large subunit ribosomal protein L4
MKAKIITLDGAAAGEIELLDDVFGRAVRKDILHRMVEWQRARKQAGTHKTKERGEVSGTTKKPYKQKGTGRARQGSLKGPHMVGGGKAHGPRVRSHAYDLTKKVRRLALKTALSAKQAEGRLVVLKEASLKDGKTRELTAAFAELGWSKPLIVDREVNEAFARAARNIKHVDVLPTVGVNVYDILRHKELVLTKAAVDALQERLA